MSQDRSIHDLLERAVRDHSPVTVDPEQAVLLRARRERRRSVVLSVAATLVVVVGGAGVLNVVDTRTRGVGPVAGPGEQAVTEDAEEVLTRAAERAAAEEAEQAAAAAEQARREVVVSVLGMSAILLPQGWTDYPVRLGDGTGRPPVDNSCSDSTHTVYRTTIGTGGASRPCNGMPLAPYVWTTGDRLPSLSSPLTQQLFADDVPVWVQDSTDSTGSPVVDVHFPGSGVLVRAAGIPVDELLTYLIVPERYAAQLTLDVRPPGDESEVVEGLVTLFSADQAVEVEGQLDLQQLDQALQQLPTGGDCLQSADQWRIDVELGQTRANHLVVDDLGGCTTVVSSLGGRGLATPEFLTLLEQLLDS